MYRSLAILALGIGLAFAPLPAADTIKPSEASARTAVIEAMKKDLEYLSSEELAGRNTGSPEIEKAADYIAGQFKAAGLEPAGKDGSWFQPFTFNYGQGKLGTPQSLTIAVGDADTKLKYAADFTPLGISATGKVSGDVAFVGYGLSVKEPAYDDYADIDVKEKTVIILRRTPKWDEKDNPFQKGPNVNIAALIDKADLAAKKGAAAVLFVNDRTLSKDKDELNEFRRDLFGTTSKVPVMHIKREVAEKLLGGKKLADLEAAIEKDGKPQSFAVKDAKVALETTITKPQMEAKNVVGTLPGAGPLADEVVVIGAHFDHVGRNEHNNSTGGQAAKGKIHPGADDNGSGTCGLMELARRYGAMKNRQGRRLVFIAFSGEELNLFGSKHYANNPIYPLEKTAVMLNMDMIGRAKVMEEEGKKRDRIVVYGHGTAEGFEKLVDTANGIFDFKMFKVAGGSGPSDHDSFYKKKIPVLFFFTGTHPDYHKPTDTVDKINFDAMAKVVDFVELFANHFTTTLDRPKYLSVRGGSEDPTDDRPRRGMGGMPRLGITPGNYGEEDKGVLVDGVTEKGAAEKAGIKPGDFIVNIGGKDVKNMDGYMAALTSAKAGVEIDITVQRKNETIKLKITPQGSSR